MRERLRLILAWPFLVIGGSFFMVGAKIGGAGARFALADTFEWLIEGHEHEKGCVEYVKVQRPYRPIPQKKGDRRTSSPSHREITEYGTIEIGQATGETLTSEGAPF